MSRAPSTSNDPGLPGLSGLAGPPGIPGHPGHPGVPGGTGFNRQPLTPEQQMQALKRVQAQAEQRVKLGMQLFKAAEARLSSQTDVLQQIKTLQKQLREQVNNDVAQSLHQYDQWIGQIDESFTTAIRKLEEKVDAVQANVVKSEANMRHMLDRAEALLDQSRCLLEQNSLKMPATFKPLPPIESAAKPGPASPAPRAIEPAEPKAPAAAPFWATAVSRQAQAASDTPLPTELRPATPVAAPPPSTFADTDLNPGPRASDRPTDQDDAGPEKIYSKLLQRLIEDAPPGNAPAPGMPAPGNKSGKARTDEASQKDVGNADAA